MKRTHITGSGSYIPPIIVSNEDFARHIFYSEQREPMNKSPEEIAEKFREITGIVERRYTTHSYNCSDIGSIAAKLALEDSRVNPEHIQQLIAAHNFGNVIKHTIQTDAVPSIASRIKHQLGIKNPLCIAYDILFGCPGWLQGVIQADAFFRAGIAEKALVVGTETLSRVLDIHDRDSMIFSDGAGAVVLEYRETDPLGPGILSTSALTFSMDEVEYINMGPSYYPESDDRIRFIKMKGRKVYEFAMKQVPAAMKACFDQTGLPLSSLKKVFIHQANEKMDEGIIRRFYQLYGSNDIPDNIMPMSIHWLGNSSVATIPTLYDLVKKGQAPGHAIREGDVILFASVGAGMNINAVCYRC